MKRQALASAALVLFFAAGVPIGPAAAQTAASPQASFSRAWTGEGLPLEQHLAVMQLHFDHAALAMARVAQQSAAATAVKQLARDVIAQRSTEIAALQSAYQKQYGQAPPAWNVTGMNGGMMGRAAMGGYGMMGGQGMMNDGMMSGAMMGQMMSDGDAYQMMMGNQSNWWGSSGAATGFVPALMRVDAMQISMATLGLRSNTPQLHDSSAALISARTTELGRLAKML